MRAIRLLSIASLICTMFVVVTAEGFAWYGFSGLCYSDVIKAKGLKEGTFTANLQNVTLSCACDNIRNATDPWYEDGVGHLGGAVFMLPVNIDDVNREKGEAIISGCTAATEDYNVHWTSFNPDTKEGVVKESHECNVEDDPVNCDHVCHAGSQHVVEVNDSCVFNHFEVCWEVTNDKNGKIIAAGKHECNWNGGRNADGTANTTGLNCESCLTNPQQPQCQPNGVCRFTCTPQQSVANCG